MDEIPVKANTDEDPFLSEVAGIARWVGFPNFPYYVVDGIKRSSRELAAFRTDLARITAERDALIAAWPGDSSRCVYHDPSDGKFRVNDGADVAFKTLTDAVRCVAGLDKLETNADG